MAMAADIVPIPIVLYINGVSVDVEQCTISIEPNIGVVLDVKVNSVVRLPSEDILGEEVEDPTPIVGASDASEEKGGVQLLGTREYRAPRFDPKEIRERIEAVMVRPGVPSTDGYAINRVPVDEEFSFYDADMLTLIRHSDLRKHPRFFSAFPKPRVKSDPPNDYGAPVEALPEIKKSDDGGSYELSLDQFSKSKYNFIDISLKTDSPVSSIGSELEHSIESLGRAEGKVLSKYPNAVGYEETVLPKFVFSKNYGDWDLCTLHSSIRVWLPKKPKKGETE